MITKRIIPCLDVTGGRVVKGVNFVNLIDAGNPVEAAKCYDLQGADELVFLDITASSDDRNTMVDIIERTASEVFIPLTVGGGIRTIEDMRKILNAGADKVSLNTAAIADPELITRGADVFGSQCIVVAIDAKRDAESKSWSVYTHGGRKKTRLDAILWAQMAVKLGAGEILLTSMDCDGTKNGSVNVPVIASGGAGELHHMADVLINGKADAVLAASIFHFGKYTVNDVKEYLFREGIHIRMID